MDDGSRGGASGPGLNQPYPSPGSAQGYPFHQPTYPDSLVYDTGDVDYYDYGRRPEPINPGYFALPDSPGTDMHGVSVPPSLLHAQTYIH